MEKFKGTPGPWVANPKGTLSNVRSEEMIVCHLISSRTHINETRLKGESWLDMYKRNEPLRALQVKEAEANCTLIASAPELLEALQSCLYLIDELGVSEGTAITQAESAINKALGINQQNK